ncbi:MAG: pyridoxamine 5'-phosphate oxidase [Chitinophagaceae bacterium]|jgi:pyridoxamine 5'-phosphate oxidase
MSIADIRKDYQLKSLSEHEVDQNPFAQFSVWWNEAVQSDIIEVNAMALSTVTSTGKPSSRIVLLKGYDEQGFVFFTNYSSDKGQQLTQNHFAALLFFWKELERQVRIEGVVSKVSEEESDAYFNSRPVGSRLGAWASPQSQKISDREVLNNELMKFTEQFDQENIPRPAHWGGYRVKPTRIEFWQGRSNRLHDRILYEQDNDNWQISRLAP